MESTTESIVQFKLINNSVVVIVTQISLYDFGVEGLNTSYHINSFISASVNHDIALKVGLMDDVIYLTMLYN